MENKNYYCEYCGHKFSNPRQFACITQIVGVTCSAHPRRSNIIKEIMLLYGTNIYNP
jgi:hypothetical protein